MNYRHWLLLVLALLLAPMLAHAGDFVCGTDVVSATSPSLHRFTASVDPTRVPPCPAPYTLYGVPETPPTLIQDQRDLYASVPHRHLKVVGGLMVEMTQAEQDLVDAPAQAQAAAEAVAKQEVTSNEICANHTLPEITAYWKAPTGSTPPSKQAQLQATIKTLDDAIVLVNAGPPKTAILAARDALVAHMTMYIDSLELVWRYMCSRTFIAPVP
jgi:hypothetical protein